MIIPRAGSPEAERVQVIKFSHTASIQFDVSEVPLAKFSILTFGTVLIG